MQDLYWIHFPSFRIPNSHSCALSTKVELFFLPRLTEQFNHWSTYPSISNLFLIIKFLMNFNGKLAKDMVFVKHHWYWTTSSPPPPPTFPSLLRGMWVVVKHREQWADEITWLIFALSSPLLATPTPSRPLSPLHFHSHIHLFRVHVHSGWIFCRQR